MHYTWDDLVVQLARIEHNQHWIMRELLKTERAVQMAYEAELDAAEAAAKQNADTDDSVEQILKTVTDLVASLKTQQTDPATAKRISDLAAALTARASQLATAAATVPTS
jgi:hypothetical protein